MSPTYTSGHTRIGVVQTQAKISYNHISSTHLSETHTHTHRVDLWFQQLPGQASHTRGTENLHHWWILRSCSHSWIVEYHSSSCCNLCCFQDPSCTPPEWQKCTMGSYGKTFICCIKFLHTLFIRQTQCSENLIRGFHQMAYDEN